MELTNAAAARLEAPDPSERLLLVDGAVIQEFDNAFEVPWLTARVAYHEAGHFVAGTAYGAVFDYVTIEPDTTALGRCQLKEPLRFLRKVRRAGAFRPNIRNAERLVSMLYAGRAADVRFSPETEAHARDGARNDDKMARWLLRLFSLESEAKRRRLRKRAAALVARRWAEVERLACVLIARVTLSGDEARAICVTARVSAR